MLLVNSNGIVAIYAYAWYEWPYHTRTIVPYAYSRTVAYVPYAYDMKYAYGTQQFHWIKIIFTLNTNPTRGNGLKIYKNCCCNTNTVNREIFM